MSTLGEDGVGGKAKVRTVNELKVLYDRVKNIVVNQVVTETDDGNP